MQFTERQQHTLQSIARNQPDFIELVEAWRKSELESMAQGTPENFGTNKGRVQLLTEMQRNLKPFK